MGRRPEWRSAVRSAAEAAAILGRVGSTLRVPDRIGELLGDGLPRYNLGEALASGSHGDVFNAIDRRRMGSGANVAVIVKFLRRRSVESDLAVEEEARHAAALSHPCAVGVVGEGIANSTTSYIVFEQVHGNSLVAMAAAESLPSGEATVTLLAEFAGAISQLHAVGICHGDVTPANVLLDRSSRLRLIDYGLSHQLDEASRAEDLVRLGELIQWLLLGFVPTSEPLGSTETRTWRGGMTARAIEIGWRLRRGGAIDRGVEESLRSILRWWRWRVLGVAAVGLIVVMVALSVIAMTMVGGT